ncbi:streptococcal hemagglutinin-like [Watersipora subatra]|uniref:streptococcal hemagglutinin-like n=1 Tax=Watersipora subatra TaxID=2589382 RepID=UPI00355C6CBC
MHKCPKVHQNSYKPFNKPTNIPRYIHTQSNHPPQIIANIPDSSSRRLNKLSSSKTIFNNATKIYQDALNDSKYQHKLIYKPQNDDDRKRPDRRKRNILWYNPPYNAAASTNIGRAFIIMIKRIFNKFHPLRKIFNQNTLKLSYSCMENVKSIIEGHNKKLLNTEKKKDNTSDRTCNCRKPEECQLEGRCLTKNLMYQAVKVDFSLSDATTSPEEKFSNEASLFSFRYGAASTGFTFPAASFSASKEKTVSMATTPDSLAPSFSFGPAKSSSSSTSELFSSTCASKPLLSLASTNSATSTSTTTTTSTFSFGASSGNISGAFLSPAPTSSQPPCFRSTGNSTAGPSFSFGGQKGETSVATTFKLGSSNSTSTSTSATGLFRFGAPVTTKSAATSTVSSTTPFAFGSTPVSSSPPMLSFGKPVSGNASTSGATIFGATTLTTPASSTSLTGFFFGNSLSVATSSSDPLATFPAPSATFSFGGQSTATTSSHTSASRKAAVSSSSASSFSFCQPSARISAFTFGQSNTKTTKAAPFGEGSASKFGDNAAGTSKPFTFDAKNTGSSPFGVSMSSGNATTAASTAFSTTAISNSIFEAWASSNVSGALATTSSPFSTATSSQPLTTGIFKATTSGGSALGTSGGIFGTAASSTLATGGFNFGATATTSAASEDFRQSATTLAVPVFNVGAASTTQSLFATAPSRVVASPFDAQTPAFGYSDSATSTLVFGASSNQTPAFGSSQPTRNPNPFGTQATTELSKPTFNFGASATPTFGDGASSGLRQFGTAIPPAANGGARFSLGLLMDRKIKQLTELLTCKICDVPRDLLAFSCLHRICNICADRLDRQSSIKNGVQVIQLTCPFCRQRTTLRPHKSLPKCLLTEQIKELMRSWQIMTSSTFSQTHGVVCFAKGTQTKPSLQKNELARIGVAQAVLVSAKPFAHKVNMESRSTTKKCDKELTELVDLIQQVNLMFPAPCNKSLPYGSGEYPLQGLADQKQLMRVKEDRNVESRLYSKCHTESFEYKRWLDTLEKKGKHMISEHLNMHSQWFLKPGIDSYNESQLTPIQTLRVKTTRRVLPKDIYEKKWSKKQAVGLLNDVRPATVTEAQTVSKFSLPTKPAESTKSTADSLVKVSFSLSAAASSPDEKLANVTSSAPLFNFGSGPASKASPVTSSLAFTGFTVPAASSSARKKETVSVATTSNSFAPSFSFGPAKSSSSSTSGLFSSTCNSKPLLSLASPIFTRSPTASTTTTSTLSFGTSNGNISGAFLSPAPTSSQSTSFSSTANSTADPSFSFSEQKGKTSVAATLKFRSTKSTSATTSATGLFGFRAPVTTKPAATSTASSTMPFAFGSTPVSSSAPVFSFGKPASNNASTLGATIFGATTSTTLANSTSSTGFSFGSSLSVATSSSAPSATFSFGGQPIATTSSQTSAFRTAAVSSLSAPAFSFGQPIASPSAFTLGQSNTKATEATPFGKGSASVFGGVSMSSGTTTTAGRTTFGTTTTSNSLFGTSASSNVFAPPSTTSSPFSSATSSQTLTTGIFTATTSAGSVFGTSGGIFGTATSSNPASDRFNFGATATTLAGTSPARRFNFGAVSTTQSSFATASNGAAATPIKAQGVPQFGTTMPPAANGGAMFPLGTAAKAAPRRRTRR